jgi:serine/threonine-protein kinase
MAQVYYGWDVKLQRPVAIKVIDARYRDDPTYAARFVREAQTIARWRHEHIINIHYADDQDGLYYFVMEYIDGQDLGRLIAQYAAQGQLAPQTEVLRIGRAVAEALDYAHQQGVIHRDVKPSNVMIAQDGRVVLTDFGLAMDVEQGSLGEIFGSARYIAPEQARDSAAAVPQSDLYALGIILYEMLTGAVPFDDPSPTTVAVQHMTALPPAPRELNPALNSQTEAVLFKALSKSPRLRFQTGDELINALEQALQSDPSTVARQPDPDPAPLPPVPEPDPTGTLKPAPVEVGPPPSRPAGSWPAAAPKRAPTMLIPMLGLLLALGAVCLLGSAALFWGRGSVANATPTGGQAGPAVIIFTAAPPATSTPLILPPTGTPTDTPTATATPRAIIIFTQTPTPTSTPTETLTPTATETTVPTPLPAETSTPESPTPTPFISNSPIGELLIAWQRDDSLFVVNQTAGPVPLAPLRLGDGPGTINGGEWRVELLDPDACVTVWKEKGNPRPPDVNCTEVGERLTRTNRQRFWTEPFNVYYNENLIDTCQQNRCLINIPLR